MTEGEKFSRAMYGTVVAFKNTLTLPTDESLFETFKYSTILTAISGLSELIGAYTFLSWYGCLTCTGLLVLLLWIERRENDALLRMYRNAAVLTKENVRRAKEAGARIGVRRSTVSGNTDTEEVRQRSDSSGTGNRKRFNGSNSSRNRNKRNAKSHR